MKPIAIAAVALAAALLAGAAEAGPFDQLRSLWSKASGSQANVAEKPTGQPANPPAAADAGDSAEAGPGPAVQNRLAIHYLSTPPRLDPSRPAPQVAPPIVDAPVSPSVDDAQATHPTPARRHAEKTGGAAPKRNVLDKWMEWENRKNAWLKRTFLGR